MDTVIPFSKKLVKGRAAYENMAFLQNEITDSLFQDMEINILDEGRYGKTFTFLIYSLYYLAREKNKKIEMIVARKIYKDIENLGVLGEIEVLKKQGHGITHISSGDSVLDCAKKIVYDMPVKLSGRLNEDLVSRIGEMFNNAKEHSSANYIIGGRYFKPNKKYCFTCYDTGVGIVRKVNHYFEKQGQTAVSDRDALSWAVKPFNSTASDASRPRGLGLDLLKNFAGANGGTIRICTGKVLYTFRGDRNKIEMFENLKHPFIGTLFEMDVIADDGVYGYKGES